MKNSGLRALTLLIVSLQVLTACGDKQPPEAPTSLGGGALQAIEPITPTAPEAPAGEQPTGNNGNFNPEDNFNGENPAPNGEPSVTTKPTAKPTAKPTGSEPTAAPSAEPSADPSPIPSDSGSTTATPTPTPDPAASATATPTPTATVTPTPTPTPVPTPTPTPTPTPVPTPTPTPDPYGNRQLSAIAANALTDPSGIDVKNGIIYVTHYIKGGVFSNNKDIVKSFQPNGASASADVVVVDQYSSSGMEPLAGVAIRGSVIWSSRKTKNSAGTNLYKNNTAGQSVATYSAGTTGTVINDIAADPTAAVLYIADSFNSTVIKFDETNQANSQMYFTGATPINPVGLAVDSSGSVFITDANTGKVLVYSRAGTKTLEFDGKGKNGTGQLFSAIGDVAVDSRNGEIYVVASADGVIKLFRYSSTGDFIRSFSSPDLTNPEKMSIGIDGTIYVVDKTKLAIMVFGPGTSP